MSWGTGPWGTGPWGGGTGGLVIPPSAVLSVISDPGPTAPITGPAVVDVLGGTVCHLLGSDFFNPLVVEIGVGDFTKIGEGFVFDAELDVTASRIFFGAPRLERGLYSVRVVTPSGTSAALVDAIAARAFADEYKTVSVRGKFSTKWDTGPRVLRSG